MSLDDNFLAEIEAAAERYESRFFIICSELTAKEALIGDLKHRPDIAELVCDCKDEDALYLPRVQFRLNELNQWLHIPCNKISAYSIYAYCLRDECRHMFFTNRNMGKPWSPPEGQKRITECPCHGT